MHPAILTATESPGRYRGEFLTDAAGAYLVNVSYAGGTQESPIRGNLQAAVCVPYSREFRAIKHNAALLDQLAVRTGGRVLAGTDPELIDLFYREGLEVPKSHKSIWDLLAILAAALFVFDVAARRVSVDPRWAAAMAARAMGRRAEATTESVAAWKRTRARVAHRADASAAAKLAEAKARFEADEADVKVSIDVAADAAKAASDRPARVTRRPDRPQEPAKDEGDYTSRLLAAKRRARGQTEGADDGGDDA